MLLLIVMLLIIYCWLNRNRVLADTVGLIFFPTMLISLVFPFFLPLVDIITWRTNSVNPTDVLIAQTQYFFFGLGVVLVSWVRVVVNKPSFDASSYSLKKKQSTLLPYDNSEIAMLRITIILSIISGCLLYSIYIFQVGLQNLLSEDEYTAKYAAAEGLGFFSFGLSLVIIGCSLSELQAGNRLSKFFTRSILVLVIVWSLLLIHSRFSAVAAIVTFACAVVQRFEFKMRDLNWRHLFLGSAILVVMSLYAVIRGFWGNTSDFSYDLANWLSEVDSVIGIIIGSSDLVHPFQTCIELVTDITGNYGPEALKNSFSSLMPLSILPDRPLSEAQIFAEKFYPSLFYKGGGTGYSLVGSSTVYLFPNIGPLIYGISLAFAAWVFEILCSRKARKMSLGVIMLISFPIYILFIERAGLIATIKPLIALSVLMGLIFITARAINALLNSFRQP